MAAGARLEGSPYLQCPRAAGRCQQSVIKPCRMQGITVGSYAARDRHSDREGPHMSDRRPGLHVGSLSDPAALELVDGVHLEQPRRFFILVPFLHDDTEKWFLGALDLAGKSILRGQVVSTRQEGIDMVGEDVVWCG